MKRIVVDFVGGVEKIVVMFAFFMVVWACSTVTLVVLMILGAWTWRLIIFPVMRFAGVMP